MVDALIVFDNMYRNGRGPVRYLPRSLFCFASSTGGIKEDYWGRGATQPRLRKGRQEPSDWATHKSFKIPQSFWLEILCIFLSMSAANQIKIIWTDGRVGYGARLKRAIA